MPSGKIHDSITVAAAAVSVPAWWWLASPAAPQMKDWTTGATLVASLLFSGLFLSPDLDLQSSIYKRWGPLRFIWLPYQKAIPHRSELSHSFVVGPVLRVVYFLFVVWALLRVVTWGLSFVLPMNRNGLFRDSTDAFLAFWRTHPNHLAMVVLGLFLGAALHVAADLISTGIKKRF